MVSCKKAGADSVKLSVPADLRITANVNVNGTGNVAFTATATNAVSYAFELGNGEIRNTTTGVLDYQYTLVGTNTYTVTVTASSSSGQTIKKTAEVTVNVKAPSNTPFWAEEFNTDGAPNANIWSYDIGGSGWGNNEAQYYTNRSDNSIIANGVLKITAKKENYQGSAYTSARLISKNKFFFKYGKVEIRAKLPAGIGTWPALWMMGNDFDAVGWPACGEIDIMEHRGSELNKIVSALHYPGRSGGNAVVSSLMISNATTAFHTYTLEWTAAHLKFYVDDQLFHTVANSNAIPYNKDFFMLLNVAMGGTFGGNIDPNFTSASMEIDYIRLYK